MLIPSEKVVIQAFAHDIRRTILKVLQARAYSFTELMKLLSLSSGKLNYHLSQIAGFISKNEKTGLYETTLLGNKAIDFLNLLQNHLTDAETSFLCEAYVSQMAGKENVQQFRQSYLDGIIEAVHLIQGLHNLCKRRKDMQELLSFLFEIEAKNKRMIVAEKRKKPVFLDPRRVDYLQGVYDTVNRAKLQLFHQRQNFIQFLSRLELEANELLSHLGKRTSGLQTFPTETEIREDLAQEFSRFKTEGDSLE